MKQIVITNVTAGILLFLGSLQWIIFSTISESILKGNLPDVPEMNVQIPAISPYISSLPLSTMIYSISSVIFGIFILISAFILYDTYRFTLFTLLFSLSGICMVGLGFFGGSVEEIRILKIAWFLIVSFSAIAGYFLVKKPFSYCSLLLGLFCLISLLLPDILGPESPVYVLGAEEVEDALRSALVLWISVLGGYFMGQPETCMKIKKRYMIRKEKN